MNPCVGSSVFGFASSLKKHWLVNVQRIEAFQWALTRCKTFSCDVIEELCTNVQFHVEILGAFHYITFVGNVACKLDNVYLHYQIHQSAMHILLSSNESNTSNTSIYMLMENILYDTLFIKLDWYKKHVQSQQQHLDLY